MRRATTIVCAAAVLVGGGAWAVAAANADRTGERAATQTGIIRATRFYGVGPWAQYAGDSGIRRVRRKSEVAGLHDGVGDELCDPTMEMPTPVAEIPVDN